MDSQGAGAYAHARDRPIYNDSSTGGGKERGDTWRERSSSDGAPVLYVVDDGGTFRFTFDCSIPFPLELQFEAVGARTQRMRACGRRCFDGRALSTMMYSHTRGTKGRNEKKGVETRG